VNVFTAEFRELRRVIVACRVAAIDFADRVNLSRGALELVIALAIFSNFSENFHPFFCI
jgi:hypothetical protein